MMKYIVIAFLLLNTYFYPLFSMESKSLHRCRQKGCGIIFFTKDELSNHQSKHQNKLKNKKIAPDSIAKSTPTCASELLPLAHVALATNPMKPMPYKEFCKLEAGIGRQYRPRQSHSAVPPSQKKYKFTQDHLDFWNNNLKKYECCQQFIEQHSYKKHVIQTHPDLYDFHHCDCCPDIIW